MSSPSPELSASDIRLIAYYLPQFHPVPENDLWWGKGFTEWTNVSKATPCFDGHYQPHLPSDLGFYDLRLEEAREAQAHLARQYGIYGFCYYYYWFNGRRILEKPLDAVLESGKPDFPFCICWANETWSRRWDGSESDVLLQQEHSIDSDERFILDVIPILKDPRYIKIDGAPLLMVYRLGIMPDPKHTAKIWRRICKEHGIPNIHLCAAQTFGFSDPMKYGFNSAAQFPPHEVIIPTVNKRIANYKGNFTGLLYEYSEVVQHELQRTPPDYKYYRGVFPCWDNTPRKGMAGTVFHNASPQKYETWLRGMIDYTRKHFKGDDRIVFINAWNEWAEGAHLEPDQKNGRANLEATKRALYGTNDWRVILDTLRGSGQVDAQTLEELQAAMELQESKTAYLSALAGVKESLTMKDAAKFTSHPPYEARDKEIIEDGHIHIDSVNLSNGMEKVTVERQYATYVRGWAFAPSVSCTETTPVTLVLQSMIDKDVRYFCTSSVRRIRRKDVSEAYPDIASDSTLFSGFEVKADFGEVPPGRYHLGVLQSSSGDVTTLALTKQSLMVV